MTQGTCKTNQTSNSIHKQPTCTCGLAEFLKYEEYFIDDEENSLFEPPDWCPIVKEEIVSFKYKRLPINNVLEISKYTNQLEQLDFELQNMDDVENEDFDLKYKLMIEIGDKIKKLSNEK